MASTKNKPKRVKNKVVTSTDGKLTTGKKIKRKKKRKTKRKRKVKPPLDVTHVKLLGLTCSSIAEAETKLQKKMDLTKILTKYEELDAAWNRGRFLRNLRALASVAVTVSEAAEKLGLANSQELYNMLDTDREVADTWGQARQEAFIKIKFALIKQANEGNQAAIRAIEPFLQDELHQRTDYFDFSYLSTNQLAQLTGKTRQTIYKWRTQHGLPTNKDNSFDLHQVLPWLEKFIIQKITDRFKGDEKLDPLKQAKAERLEMELKKHRGELLNREEVMAGLLARYQILLFWAERRPDELGRLCQGQKPERITKLIKEAVIELRRDLCQVPEELQLSDKASKLFQKVLDNL